MLLLALLIMNVDKKIIVLKAVMESQFGYCPLVWMFHNRNLNNEVNKIHEGTLRITYNDKYYLSRNCLRRITLSHYATEILKF